MASYLLCQTSYPAGHLWIHSALRRLFGDGLSNGSLWGVQQLYGGLYLLNLGVSFAIYWLAGGMPNYAILPLILSKRLHSIYVLRLFNDCWAVLGMAASVAAYQRRHFLFGSLFFRSSLSFL
jgi:alpha-1,3-mannosyltransferase